MKKLMFAVSAALCATVGFSDVTSANVVGYQGLPVIKGGNTMVAPTFAKISTAEKFTLKDLAVTGYAVSEWKNEGDEQDPDWMWSGGCKNGQFNIQVLDKSGNPLATYYWLDYTKGTANPAQPKNIFGPGWYTYVSGQYVAATVEQLATEFDQGIGFWIYSNATVAEGKSKVEVLVNGQVTQKEVAFNLTKGGNTATGVATPRAVKLSELTVTGYAVSEWKNEGDEQDPDWMWSGGCKNGQFNIQVLDKSGNPLETYYWLDYTKGTANPAQPKNIFGPGWYTYVSGQYVAATTEQLATEYPAGQGFWVYSNATVDTKDGNKNVKLVIPGVDL